MIVGIDPSLTSTGVVVLSDTGEVLGAAQVPSGPGAALHVRLREIAESVACVIWRSRDGRALGTAGFPDGPPPRRLQVFVEEPGGALKGAAQDCRTLFWFIVEQLCTEGWCDVSVYSIAPATLCKFITGRGNAKADDKCAAVMKRWMHLLPEEFHVSPESKGGVGRCKDLFDGMGLAQAGLVYLTGEGTVAQKSALKGKVRVIVAPEGVAA